MSKNQFTGNATANHVNLIMTSTVPQNVSDRNLSHTFLNNIPMAYIPKHYVELNPMFCSFRCSRISVTDYINPFSAITRTYCEYYKNILGPNELLGV